MKINHIIKEKRIERGYTQEQLASILGVTAPAVNKWEKGSSFPDITLLPVLARALKNGFKHTFVF
ncbi:MAG: helix-turn-helix transcriptional regulator [Acutalibacteraceae bacterium]|nr:helix-turn-helix transcriptional regulator [Acutalibacteraceae bacterium]